MIIFFSFLLGMFSYLILFSFGGPLSRGPKPPLPLYMVGWPVILAAAIYCIIFRADPEDI